jgi:hypothetical protein
MSMAGKRSRCPFASDCDYCAPCPHCGGGRREVTEDCTSCGKCSGVREAVRALNMVQQRTRQATPPCAPATEMAKLQALHGKIEHDSFEAEHCSDPDIDYCRSCDNYEDCFGMYEKKEAT